MKFASLRSIHDFQTDEFLGRRLAKRLKGRQQGVDKAADVSSARAPGHGGDGKDTDSVQGDEEGGRKVLDVLGKEKRSDEMNPLDLEVLDDRELYQHLLKVS